MEDYPKPLVIEPLQLPHKQTFILLHGRGSTADKFGPTLLEAEVASPPPCSPTSSTASTSSTSSPPTPTTNPTKPPLTLATAFPHARFVFPTAARRRATVYRRAYTHQWFNNWKLDPPATEREDLQADGLRETAAHLHALLRAEAALVPGGEASVVLGGLSQGCAAGLVALLLWEGPPLAAVVGMCGWLPYAERLVENAGGGGGDGVCDEEGDDGFDPFAREEGDDGPDDGSACSPAAAAVGWLRDEIGLVDAASPAGTLRFQDIPIFLGHGTEDDRVSVVLGRRATECLTTMGGEVSWNEYQGLGHWYSGPMLRDLVGFIRKQTGWENEQ